VSDRVRRRVAAVAANVASQSGTPTLAVLYCENNSGDPALNTWRTNLPELLIGACETTKASMFVFLQALVLIVAGSHPATVPATRRQARDRCTNGAFDNPPACSPKH
jgi:hypothetical protein